MKKLAAFVPIITYLILAGAIFAETPTPTGTVIQISPPVFNNDPTKRIGYTDINEFINNILILVFIVAIVAVLFMLVWGALQWIFSGGEKEAVASARNRIIHALVGLAILAIAIAVARLAGQFLGVDLFTKFEIPHPS